MQNKITVQTSIKAPLEKVWNFWNDPKHIVNWAFASEDWHAPEAENDLRVGGNFKTVMAARDGSAQFDFAGTYTAVKENESIEYNLGNERHIEVKFEDLADGVKVTEIFDPEKEHPMELQKNGWQAILDNFKSYVEKESL